MKNSWLVKAFLVLMLTGCSMPGSNGTTSTPSGAAQTYTVTYNGNGNTSGSVPTDGNNYLQGKTVTVLGNTGGLVKVGFTFVGWNTQSNGNGTTYSPGQVFSMGSSNVTLYALWTTATTYTVTYNGNGNTGGSVPIDSNNYIQGQTVDVLGNSGKLSKSNYVFTGWNTLASGMGTSYSQGNTFTMGTSSVLLYAVWTPAYNVIYVANGSTTAGSVPNDPNPYIRGQTVTVLANPNDLTWTGYALAGWNTKGDGTGTTYQMTTTSAATFTMGSANVTLYAVWIPSTPGLVFGTNNDLKSGVAGNVVIPAYWNTQPITAIDGDAFEGISGLTSVTIPNNVEAIGEAAFQNCSNLTSVTLPSTLYVIDRLAFNNCSALTSLTLPTGLANILDEAFNGCNGLTQITIPSTVGQMGAGVFSYCTGLKSVIANPTSPPVFLVNDSGDAFFQGSSNLTTIEVPDGSVNTYRTNQYWSTYSSLIVGQ